MLNVIKLSKGLDFELAGKAENRVEPARKSKVYAIVPDDFTGVKPKPVVREGDRVRAGEPLFVNKDIPQVQMVSPVSGTVCLVERGERRKLMSIRVEADATQDYKTFTTADAEKLTGEEVKALMLEAGLWAFMRERPYDVIANPSADAKGIFISAFSKMPLSADFSFVVKDQMADFQAGLTALSKIAPVYLGISPAQAEGELARLKDVATTVFDGPNPSGNVGIQINHIAPINKGETVWTMGAEAVIFIGRLLRTGVVDLSRTIAVAGSEVESPSYANVLIGSEIESIVGGRLQSSEHVRIISGNPLVGCKVGREGFLGAFATEVTVIPEGDDVHEMFGWILPRFSQFSTSRSYFSWLFGKKREYRLDARIKGGERHIIMANEYDRVLPMDILPEFLIKAIITGNIDRMEALGIYEIAPEDFAVAEFVDSSKLELQRIVREGLDMFRKEMA